MCLQATCVKHMFNPPRKFKQKSKLNHGFIVFFLNEHWLIEQIKSHLLMEYVENANHTTSINLMDQNANLKDSNNHANSQVEQRSKNKATKVNVYLVHEPWSWFWRQLLFNIYGKITDITMSVHCSFLLLTFIDSYLIH